MQPDWMLVIESINTCIYRKQKVFCLLSHVSHKFPGQWVILANQADDCPLFLCVPSCNVQPWSRPCKWSSHHVPLDTENVALNDELFFPKRNWHTAEQSSFFLSSSLFTSLEIFQGRKLLLFSGSISVEKHFNKLPSTATRPLNSGPIQI